MTAAAVLPWIIFPGASALIGCYVILARRVMKGTVK